jgi:2-polyprenyl-3-methyl-5-hydroxy-6-metoxy-1,4-benzoquinol methylase
MSTIERICRSYDDRLIRAYATVRFHILRQRFLDEIGQYLPTQGNVLDIGCGFGLFSLYFAHAAGRRLLGCDLNERRISAARRAAGKLGLTNVEFIEGDARSLSIDKVYDAVFMLDIVHHIPTTAVVPLLEGIRSHLAPGGVLLIKDVADRPAYKRWFTWALDKAMDYRTPVHYWSAERLAGLLQTYFKTVHVHQMVDYLPYPHVLYVCRT